MTSSVVASIRASALRNNLDVLRVAGAGANVMAVVKANAYGHGLIETANCLSSADAFAVARIAEAAELRAAGIRVPVVCLGGPVSANEVSVAGARDIQLVIHSTYQLDLLSAADVVPALWIKVDTGMGRLGFSPAELTSAASRAADLTVGGPDVGLMTHFACADEPSSPANAAQDALLRQLVSDWRGPVSWANSAAMLSGRSAPPMPHGNEVWSRPGLALYGVSPLTGRDARTLGLLPAMQLSARVIAIRQLQAGGAVGYGGDWRASRPSRIAVLGAGYADGVPWRQSSRGHVVFGDRHAPIVGRVSMDMTSVDVTDLPEIAVGDRAELWGGSIAVETIAESAGTIPYEVLTGVGPRVTREFLE